MVSVSEDERGVYVVLRCRWPLPAMTAVCPRRIAKSSVVEISLAGLGAASKIYISEESHTK
jgi:hypothetical protein